MQEITFRNDLNPSKPLWHHLDESHCCQVLYTALQKIISLHPLKVLGFGISLLVGCPKRAV